MRILIKQIENFRTRLVRESITIDTKDYPELEGKTIEEIREHILEYGVEMKPPFELGWEDDLMSAIENQEVAWDEFYDQESDIVLTEEI